MVQFCIAMSEQDKDSFPHFQDDTAIYSNQFDICLFCNLFLMFISLMVILVLQRSKKQRGFVGGHLVGKGLKSQSGTIASYSCCFETCLVSFSFQNMFAPLTCTFTACFSPADLTAADTLLGIHCVLPSPVTLCIATGQSWGASNKSLRYFPKYQITKNKY